MEHVTLTRQSWKPRSYTMTYFEGRAMVRIGLFITYGEIRDRIAMGVGSPIR